MSSRIHELVSKHSLISDQVSPAELLVILEELELAISQTNDGDIVEFGCYSGTTSLFIQRFLLGTESARGYRVYDSFEGLPEKSSHDKSPAGEQFVAGELSSSKKDFIQNFRKANLPVPKIHKGWFNELGSSELPDRIAFAFLDGDYYLSIKQSLELVEPRLVRGAVIIVDDYQSEQLPGAQKAVDEWLQRNQQFKTRTELGLAIIRDGREGRQ